MQPEMYWQLRPPWVCKLLLAEEESVGKAKEIILGEFQMKMVPGLAAPSMLSMEGTQGGDPTPRKGVSQQLGLLRQG